MNPSELARIHWSRGPGPGPGTPISAHSSVGSCGSTPSVTDGCAETGSNRLEEIQHNHRWIHSAGARALPRARIMRARTRAEHTIGGQAPTCGSAGWVNHYV